MDCILDKTSNLKGKFMLKVRFSNILLTEWLIHNSKNKSANESIKKMINDGNNAPSNTLTAVSSHASQKLHHQLREHTHHI